MATVIEVEQLALGLPDDQRAELAAHLLDSLPAILADADEGVAEARQRDEEIDRNPSLGISLEQLQEQIARRPRN